MRAPVRPLISSVSLSATVGTTLTGALSWPLACWLAGREKISIKAAGCARWNDDCPLVRDWWAFKSCFFFYQKIHFIHLARTHEV
uniref:Putative secreted protein n=1 Tax=Anopheles marajoara TaxID=58244 RepID=A0A2M4CAR3_9DIPT